MKEDTNKAIENEMKKMRDTDKSRKILECFTKDELIDGMLHTGWIFNPITTLYQNRIDKNHKENEKFLDEIDRLLSSMKNNPDRTFQISKQIDILNKKIDKNWKEDEKLTKIFHGGNDD